MTECSSPTPSAPSCWLAGQALTAAAVLLPEQLREHRARCPGLSRPSCSHCWESQARQRRPWPLHTVPQQARSLGTIPAGLSSPTSVPDSQHPLQRPPDTPSVLGLQGVSLPLLLLWPHAVCAPHSASCCAALCPQGGSAHSGAHHLGGGLHKGGLDPPPRFRCGNVITVGEGRVGLPSECHPLPSEAGEAGIEALGCTCLPRTPPPGPLSGPIGTPTSLGRRVGWGLALSPSLWPAVGSCRIRERKFGVGFLSEWNLPWRLFILLYFYHVGHSPPLALNGSGFESFLQNYTTASCFAVPRSPSVQRRGAALALPCWGAHVGLSTWPLPGGPGGCVSGGA